jgi:hypothetical protein
MRCDKIQEEIISLYATGLRAEKQEIRIRSHIADCPACREFAFFAREAGLNQPVENSEVNLPDSLWPAIKAGIIREHPGNNSPVSGLLAGLDWLISFSLPSFTYVVIIFTIAFFALNLQGIKGNNANIGEKGYFTYVLGCKKMNLTMEHYFFGNS